MHHHEMYQQAVWQWQMAAQQPSTQHTPRTYPEQRCLNSGSSAHDMSATYSTMAFDNSQYQEDLSAPHIDMDLSWPGSMATPAGTHFDTIGHLPFAEWTPVEPSVTSSSTDGSYTCTVDCTIGSSDMDQSMQFSQSSQASPSRSLTTGSDNDEDARPRCWEHGCEGKVFSCAENYRRHVRERSRQESIACPHCAITFSRKSNRDTHLAKGRCKALGGSTKPTRVRC